MKKNPWLVFKLSKFSRRTAMLYTDLLNIVCCCFGAIANIYTYGLHRFLVGITGSINAVFIAIYVREACPVTLYGKMGYISAIFIIFGSCISYVTGFYTCTIYDNSANL